LKKFDHYLASSNLQSVCNNACQQQKFQSARTDAELLEFSRYGLLKLIVNYDNFYYTSMVENPSIDSNMLFGYFGAPIDNQN
jgi:hypothetical protein